MRDENAAWFALCVVPRKEKAAAQSLRAKGYEDFLPMYKVRKRWSDRVKDVENPLFPGYVFARFDPKLRLPILKIPSVMSVVSLGREPEPIPDIEIESLRRVCEAGMHTIPYPFLKEGAKLRVNEGPLAGVEGIVLEAKETQLILSITLLQRSVAVSVDSEWIAPTRTYRKF
ncbi:MAG: UpxY family transcription antiterminator [Acidobacteriota bacterium]|nr:UpxY family transcription antiterminator [Acidobacteriota bacterium]